MARPTDTPFSWATSAGVRAVISSGLQAAGFTGPDVLPDGEFNGLLGRISDWVRWWATYQDAHTFSPGTGIAVVDTGDVAGLTAAQTTTAEPVVPVWGHLRAHNNSATAQFQGLFPHAFPADGTPSKVSVSVEAVTNTSSDGHVKVYLIDTDGNTVGYTGTPTATGDLILTYSAADSVGTGTSSEQLDTWVSVTYFVEAPSTSGDVFELSAITITY